MKKTFALSISGRIFQVEEDAYALLLDYLDSLSQIFRGADGKEIVDDIEARISDIFQEQLHGGKVVFTIADAEHVITVIGNAAQIAAESEDAHFEENVHSTSGQCQEATQNAGEGYRTRSPEIKRKLYRSQTDKVLGGVLGGLAVRVGVSVLPLRIILLLMMFPLGFLPLFFIYCIAWAIIPLANTPERVLEQQGRPVTVANVGEALSAQAARPAVQDAGSAAFRVIGALFMGFLALLAGILGISMLIAVFALLAGLFAVAFGTAVPFALFDIGDFSPLTSTCEVSLALISAICICLALLIPCIALVWAACSVLFKAKGASRTVWIIALAVEAIAIVFPAIVLSIIY